MSLVELQTDQFRQLHQQRQELAQLISHADHNEQLFQIFEPDAIFICLYSSNWAEDAIAASFSRRYHYFSMFVTRPDLADFQHIN